MAAASPISRGTVEKESVGRGHHMYKAILTPVIREELLTQDLAFIRTLACIRALRSIRTNTLNTYTPILRY